MTTPTIENTVFIVAPEVKAEPEKPTKPERCETGKALIRAWSKAMNEAAHADEGKWLDVWGKGYMPYALHSKDCILCANYNFSLTAPTVEEK